MREAKVQLWIFIKSALAYSAFTAIAWATLHENAAFSLSLLLLGGIASIALCTSAMRRTKGWWQTFGGALAVASMAYRAVAMVEIGLGVDLTSQWQVIGVFSTAEILDAILLGEYVTVIGTLALIAVWDKAGGGKSIALLYGRAATGSVPLQKVLVVYALGFAAGVAQRYFGLDSNGLGLVPSVVYFFGIASLMFVEVRGRPNLELAAVAFLTVPLVVLAMGGGMKENIIIAALPFMMRFWARLPNPVLRAGLIGMAVVIATALVSYTQFIRYTFWPYGEQPLPSVTISAFSSAVRQGDANILDREAFEGLLSRINPLLVQGGTVAAAYTGQELPGAWETVSATITNIVPRVVWPDKPINRPGFDHSRLLFGDQFVENVESATAAGFFAELYLLAGWLGAFCGALFFGILIAVIERMTRELRDPMFNGVMALMLFHAALRWNELHLVYSFATFAGFWIVGCLYCLALGTMDRSLQRGWRIRAA
jgi:hypothetical protein